MIDLFFVFFDGIAISKIFYVREVDPELTLSRHGSTTWSAKGRTVFDPGTLVVLSAVIFRVDLFFVFFDGTAISKIFHFREVDPGSTLAHLEC